MIVLSLFDGMSCGRAALESAVFKVDKYFASEIDKYAMAVSAYNYPDIIQIGDVCKVDVKTLPKIDLILAGSPCQGFSLAGKQLNFNDPRSALFFEFVRILKEVREINPDVKFLLENVKMKREYQDRISDIMGCNPIVINSALVSAQNRVRLYWTNIEVVGLPEDRGILLKDILEDDVPEKYYIKNPKFDFSGLDINKKGNTLRTGGCQSQTNKHNYDLIKVDIKGNPKSNQDKADCLTGGAHSGGNHSDMDLIVVGNLYDNNPQGGRIYSPEGKGSCLNGEAGGCGAKTGLYAVCGASRGRNPENPKSRESGLETEQQLEMREDQKTNCLTSVQKDNLIATNSIRRLTPGECESLQTMPKGYTAKGMMNGKEVTISDSQRYKMLGNGWTRDVIAFILQFMDENKVKEAKAKEQQTTLFDIIGEQ